MPLLQHEPSEVFAVLFLSTRHHVLAYHEVGRGTLDTVLVTPREVFKAAILANAAAVILCHSHPSGDPTPSPDDVALTGRLAAAGTLLGIEVLDHIIVGRRRLRELARTRVSLTSTRAVPARPASGAVREHAYGTSSRVRRRNR